MEPSRTQPGLRVVEVSAEMSVDVNTGRLEEAGEPLKGRQEDNRTNGISKKKMCCKSVLPAPFLGTE